MRLVLRVDPTRIRKAFSLTCSLTLHGAAILWALLPGSPGGGPGGYEVHIRSHATRIVWYSLKQTLPPISPAEPTRELQPARALTRSPRTLVAGKQDLLRPPQLIWIPAPPLAEPSLLPSPNIVALTPPARPQPPAFIPPPESPAKAPVTILPAAPELAAAIDSTPIPKNLLPPVERARKTFVPPAEAVHRPRPTPLNLPAVPQVTAQNRVDASLAIVSLLPTPRPQIPIPTASQEAGFSTGPQARPSGSNDAPVPSQIAIPGLLARSGTPAPEDRQSLLAAVLEPPTSARNLVAASNLPLRTSRRSENPALRQEPPDPRFQGRMVYGMALQMPNVTSYSGSWLVWFAERGTAINPNSVTPPSDLTLPYPIHKVDPRYIPSAIDDRVEGNVRLAAVIRKDGKVDSVEVLRSLDERLDRSAAEALAKWEFAPAQRAGAPIDVDAVFEIPFHLAPRAANSRPSP